MKWYSWLSAVMILSLLSGSTSSAASTGIFSGATPSDAVAVKPERAAGRSRYATSSDATGSDATGTNRPAPKPDLPGGTHSDATPAEATASVARLSGTYGLVLDENSIIVYDYKELKQALSENNTYTTIYLGNDIATDNSGAVINAAKESVIIDGRPPGEEDQPGYTLTQYTSTDINYTFRIASTNKNTKEAVLRNLTITGGNYYGIISVQAEGVLLVHDQVHYSGPQPVYNRGGTTRFTDSTYLLKTTGGIATNELAETKHAEFGGVVTVNAPSTANSILYLVDTASSLTLLEGADVSINTNYYFIYTGGYTPTVTMAAGSRLNLASSRFGMTYADQRISTFVMAEDAELIIDLKTTESYAALRISKLFQMEPDSRMTIVRTGTAGIPLRFTNAGAKGIFNRPGRVLLYSSAGVPLRFTGAGTLEVTTSAINAWKAVAWPLTETIDQLPDHIWNKAGDEVLTLTGTYTEAVNNRLEHNLAVTDPVVSLLNAANFNLEKNQLIAFGSIGLTIDGVQTGTPAFTGVTEPEADLRADYYADDHTVQTVTGTADAAGTYELPVTKGPLLKDSTVSLITGANRLYLRQQKTVGTDPGRLQLLSVPSRLFFEETVIPEQTKLIRRQDNDSFRLRILDSREEVSPWRLDVWLEGLPEFGGTVIFKDQNDQIEAINEMPLTIYHQIEETGGEQIISWQADEGILLQVSPGNVYSDLEYQTTIHWSLIDGP